jgi:outer membrane lipoprotein-sorting protein
MKRDAMSWTVRMAGLCLAAVFAISATAAAAAKPDAQKLFQEMLKQSLNLKDYTFKFDHKEINPKTKKEDATSCEFWWKTPDYRKLIVHQGQHKGSVVVYNPDKSKTKVFGKQAGVEIPGGMPKDAKMVEPFFKVGWQNDMIALKKSTREGKFALSGEDKVRGRKAWKITVTGAKDEYDKVVIWIDQKDKVLLKHEYYKSGKFDSSTEIYDIKINADLKTDVFKP